MYPSGCLHEVVLCSVELHGDLLVLRILEVGHPATDTLTLTAYLAAPFASGGRDDAAGVVCPGHHDVVPLRRRPRRRPGGTSQASVGRLRSLGAARRRQPSLIGSAALGRGASGHEEIVGGPTSARSRRLAMPTVTRNGVDGAGERASAGPRASWVERAGAVSPPRRRVESRPTAVHALGSSEEPDDEDQRHGQRREAGGEGGERRGRGAAAHRGAHDHQHHEAQCPEAAIGVGSLSRIAMLMVAGSPLTWRWTRT